MAPIYSKFISFLGLKAQVTSLLKMQTFDTYIVLQEEAIRRVLLLLETKPIHPASSNPESEASLYSVLSVIVMPALLASTEATKQMVISSLMSQFSDFIESCHSLDINAQTSLLPIQQVGTDDFSHNYYLTSHLILLLCRHFNSDYSCLLH